MIYQFSLVLLAVVGLSMLTQAQEKQKVPPVQIRVVLHDPVNPTADLYYADKAGAILPLDFRPKSLSKAVFTRPVNGSLVLYDKASVDPENPAESVAASVKLPPNIKRAMVLVLPNLEDKKPAYRMLVIHDSEKAFPKGESRVVLLIDVKAAIVAGEHRLEVNQGKLTRVPPVKKVNEYNMAQTNFYYQQGGSWKVFTERQLQYIDACRRLFIIDATPRAITPRVTTIVDTLPVN
jgi:hypothetical protein